MNYGDQIAQISDRCERFTSIGKMKASDLTVADKDSLAIAARRCAPRQFGAFAQVRAIDAKDLVVGAGNQIIAGVVVGLVAFPDPDPLQPDQHRFIVFHRHFNAAAFAIDAAAKPDFSAGVLGDDVIAIAAGIEIAGAVAIFEALGGTSN
ncbi:MULTISPECIES: hypothetical protein [unclassified Bradyrhizobium]|uniref:hypothetical protein n=1 Tax=unclassified Bradyrhizobium TaxID=2631580 RepID=UPI002FEFA5F6